MREIAEWASTVDGDKLPAAVSRTSRLLVADTVGAMARGSAERTPTRLFQRLAGPSSQRAGGIVVRQGLPMIDSASSMLPNSVAGAWFELDPGHDRARTHGPIHVLPVLLSEDLAQSSADQLTAFTIGVEVAYRIGRAVRPSATLHPHGVWATVGAAAAASRIAQLSPVATFRTLTVAGHLMLATSSRSVAEGATVRNALPGIAAQHGVAARELASAGLGGLGAGIEAISAGVLNSVFDPLALTEGLGERFELERSFFKLHACCHHLAAAAEAAIAVHGQLGNDLERVTEVEVGTYRHAAGYGKRHPRNQLAAMFSLPYVVSAGLVVGSVSPESFVLGVMADPRRRAIEQMVSVHIDEPADRAYPDRRSATVIVHLRGGTRVAVTTDQPLGTPGNPVPESALRDKFASLGAGVFGIRTAAVWSDLARLSSARSFQAILHGGSMGSDT